MILTTERHVNQLLTGRKTQHESVGTFLKVASFFELSQSNLVIVLQNSMC